MHEIVLYIGQKQCCQQQILVEVLLLCFASDSTLTTITCKIPCSKKTETQNHHLIIVHVYCDAFLQKALSVIKVMQAYLSSSQNFPRVALVLAKHTINLKLPRFRTCNQHGARPGFLHRWPLPNIPSEQLTTRKQKLCQ